MAKKKSYRGGGRTAAAMAGRRPSRGARQGALARHHANQPSKRPPMPTGAIPPRHWKGATGGKVMDKTKPN